MNYKKSNIVNENELQEIILSTKNELQEIILSMRNELQQLKQAKMNVS